MVNFKERLTILIQHIYRDIKSEYFYKVVSIVVKLIMVFIELIYNIIRSSHTLKIRPGGGQIPEMIQVCDYDILIVLGELNTLI